METNKKRVGYVVPIVSVEKNLSLGSLPIKISWYKDMVGALPVFSNIDTAKEYALEIMEEGQKMEILPVYY